MSLYHPDVLLSNNCIITIFQSRFVYNYPFKISVLKGTRHLFTSFL